MLHILRQGLSMIILISLLTPLSTFAGERADFDDDTLQDAMTEKEVDAWEDALRDKQIESVEVERVYSNQLNDLEKKYGKLDTGLSKTIKDLRKVVERDMERNQKNYDSVKRSYESQNEKIQGAKANGSGAFPKILSLRLRLDTKVKWPYNIDRSETIGKHVKETGNEDWGPAWGKANKLESLANRYKDEATRKYNLTNSQGSALQKVKAYRELEEGNIAYIKMLSCQFEAYKIKTNVQLEVAVSMMHMESGAQSSQSESAQVELEKQRDQGLINLKKKCEDILDSIRSNVAARLAEVLGTVIKDGATYNIGSDKDADHITLGNYEDRSSGYMKMTGEKENVFRGRIEVAHTAGIQNDSPGGKNTLTIDGNIEIHNGATLTIKATNSDIIISGIISNPGHDGKIIIISSEGRRVIFSAANSFGGDIDIQKGILQIEHEDALGNTGSGSFISNTKVSFGASLEMKMLGSPVMRNEFFILEGDGINNSGAIRIIGGDVIFRSKVKLNASTSFYVGPGNTLRFLRNISGFGDLKKLGKGVIEVSSTDEYQGNINVLEGVFALSISNGIPDHSDVLLSGGKLNLNGFSDTFNELIITKDSVIDMGHGSGKITIKEMSDASIGNYSLAVYNYTGGKDSMDGRDHLIFNSHDRLSKINQFKFYQDEGITLISEENVFYGDGNQLVPHHIGAFYNRDGFWFAILDAIDMIALAMSGLIPLTWFIVSKIKKSKAAALKEEYDSQFVQSEVYEEVQAEESGYGEWFQAEDGQWVITDEEGRWITEDGSEWVCLDQSDETPEA